MKNEYLLLTPGPLSTSETVREAMLKDWCTWMMNTTKTL
ncbi:2-aminoethylphosphonate:pyruvate aminotransferase [Vibrio sp. JCM 18904]|nr:2-aminoethylphosphonate:pyruvate aminotransferase [Vibrio sp. JCM 18904]